MAEDLAIDVGLERGQPDYQQFVKDVNHILKHGRPRFNTTDLLYKCKQSELDIAQQVIATCVPNNKRWWQNYTSRFTTPKRPAPSSPPPIRRKQQRRPMSPLFQRRREPGRYQREQGREPGREPGRYQREPGRYQREPRHREPGRYQRERSRSPKVQRERSMSPLVLEERYRNPNNQLSDRQRQPMSPLFQSDVPHWPTRAPKRRRR